MAVPEVFISVYASWVVFLEPLQGPGAAYTSSPCSWILRVPFRVALLLRVLRRQIELIFCFVRHFVVD